MTITDVHKLTAEVVGEMSLAIARKKAPDDIVEQWVRRLRIAADGLQERLPAKPKET